MYVKKNISYQLCSDLTIMNEKYFESLLILLKVECCEVVCGTIYRSPNHSSNAFDIFANNLSTNVGQWLNRFLVRIESYFLLCIFYLAGFWLVEIGGLPVPE